MKSLPKKGVLFSFVSKSSDLFPVETSYVYRPEENIFAPLISAQNLML